MRKKEIFPSNKFFYKYISEKLKMFKEDNQEYLIIFDDKDEPEIYLLLFLPLLDPKEKGKEILNETASKQKVRNAFSFLKDNNLFRL